MRYGLGMALLVSCLALAACQTTEPARPETSAAPSVTTLTPAVHAPVATRDRSRREANRDDVIQSVVLRNIHELDQRAFRAVTVEVWQGRVLLMGAVIKPEQRRKAEQVAAANSSVSGVINELVLAEDPALDLFVPDYAGEERVRQQVGIEGKSSLIVRVIHGVAFLLGSVATPAEAESLKEDAGDAEGIKWVVAHLDAPAS